MHSERLHMSERTARIRGKGSFQVQLTPRHPEVINLRSSAAYLRLPAFVQTKRRRHSRTA